MFEHKHMLLKQMVRYEMQFALDGFVLLDKIFFKGVFCCRGYRQAAV
jgi:hypothetical protein